MRNEGTVTPLHLQPQEAAHRNTLLYRRLVPALSPDAGWNKHSLIQPFLQIHRAFHTKDHIAGLGIHRP